MYIKLRCKLSKSINLICQWYSMPDWKYNEIEYPSKGIWLSRIKANMECNLLITPRFLRSQITPQPCCVSDGNIAGSVCINIVRWQVYEALVNVQNIWWSGWIVGDFTQSPVNATSLKKNLESQLNSNPPTGCHWHLYKMLKYLFSSFLYPVVHQRKNSMCNVWGVVLQRVNDIWDLKSQEN